MMPFRFQLMGSLACGILVGLLLTYAVGLAGGDMSERTQPFITQSDMLMVTILFFDDAAPEVVEIVPLDKGRITVTPAGPYSLSLLDQNEQALFRLPYNVVFVKPGEPPKITDQVELTIVIPSLPEAVRLVVDGPTGKAQVDLSQ